MKYLWVLMIFITPLAAEYEPNRILFLLTQGHTEEAIDIYQEHYKAKGKHDFELLQQISLIVLDQSFKSREPEVQLMAVFSAGLAGNDRAFYLLEEALRSSFPQIQIVALQFLGRTQNDQAYELINRAMGSPYALIRVEAAHQLAKKKHPKATAQIEALMQKIDASALTIFPQLFATVGDEAALKNLRKLMSHKNHKVRVAAILSACNFHRDDLLPEIRKLARQHDSRQQEAAATALGIFQDHASIDLLTHLAQSPHISLSIAALCSLYQLGNKSVALSLELLAKQGNLFAIYALGSIPGSEDTLASLAKSNQLQIRLNATLALLELKDRRAMPGLMEILVHDMRDLALDQIHSHGKSLTAWKAIPSATHQNEDDKVLHEVSLSFKEELLEMALALPEDDFLKLARLLFDTKQNALVPYLVELLVNLDTEGAISLLKQQQQKAGAPLIRNYALLGLLKLKEEGPYSALLTEWVTKQQEVEMMKFRELVPYDLRDPHSTYALTPQESARLLVESLEVLGNANEEAGIDLLLKVFKEGHPRNRPVVAALLLHFAQ